jgi:hypothetical protein
MGFWTQINGGVTSSRLENMRREVAVEYCKIAFH